MSADTVELQERGSFFNDAGSAMKRESEDNEILRVRVGSHLYGTATQASDVDYYTVWVPSARSMVGLTKVKQFHDEGVEHGSPFEVTRYPVNLITRHMLKCNPNMIEVFYANTENVVREEPLGKLFRADPTIFLSAEACYKTFRGYAHEQRRKMTFKRERINGFKEALDKVDAWASDHHPVLPETLVIKSELNDKGSWRTFEKGFVTSEVRAKIAASLDEYGWRKDLIAEHGYDVKFAANLIRIMGECFDLFRFGEIRFPLSTRDSLREIRAGKWKLEEVVAASEEWERRVDEVYPNAKLPKESNYRAAEDLMVRILAEHWGLPQLTDAVKGNK